MGHLTEALEALEGGGVVVFPTETVWGMGCRLDRPDGINKIFELKGRPDDKPLQVLLPDIASIELVARPSGEALRLAKRFMPGPLTLVLPAIEGLPDLGGRTTTIGVRVPDHPTALDLLNHTGPMPATSANRSGEPTPPDLDAIRALFGREVDAYIDGPPPRGVASTVAAMEGDGIRVLRRGAIDEADLRTAGNEAAG